MSGNGEVADVLASSRFFWKFDFPGIQIRA
ncbi:hypothetical protein DEMA109039_11805 [Deinococcus marmoris]